MLSQQFLARIQSLRQRIDHFVCSKLNDDVAKNYLEHSNLYQIELQFPSKKPVFTGDDNDLPEEHSSEEEEHSSEEEHELAETQIMSRKSLRETHTIQSLSDLLDINYQRFDLWLKRGKLWQEKGDYAAAFSDFLRAYKLSKNAKIMEAIEELQSLHSTKGNPVNLVSLLPKN